MEKVRHLYIDILYIKFHYKLYIYKSVKARICVKWRGEGAKNFFQNFKRLRSISNKIEVYQIKILLFYK